MATLARGGLGVGNFCERQITRPVAEGQGTIKISQVRFGTGLDFAVCVVVGLERGAIADRRFSNSILRHAGINFVRPRIDATPDALDVFETLLAQEIQRLQRPHANLAVQVILLVRVQFGEPVP